MLLVHLLVVWVAKWNSSSIWLQDIQKCELEDVQKGIILKYDTEGVDEETWKLYWSWEFLWRKCQRSQDLKSDIYELWGEGKWERERS